jgi:uncharacterized repeat protein (TIGR03803 family)
MIHSAHYARRVTSVLTTLALGACCLATVAARADAAQRARLRPPATRATQYAQLYAFPSNITQGGESPAAALTVFDGLLYGTTSNGGLLNKAPCEGGCGTVFSIGENGGEAVVTSFGAASGTGTIPLGGVAAHQGLLYGATSAGGNDGLGAVFAVSPGGQMTTLYSFTGQPDGNQPQAGVVLAGHDTFYGTTYLGGASNQGTVYAVTAGGSEHVVYSFAGGSDGRNPTDGLLFDGHKMLYGTTHAGGDFNGTVFAVTSAGRERVVYDFQGIPDGAFPVGDLIADAAGNMYGTTSSGGTAGGGTVFEIDTAGSEHVLYSFLGGTDGQNPQAGVITDGLGHLFGTTRDGGGIGDGGSQGTVFELDIASGQETVLHRFAYDPFGSHPNYDGANPLAPLVFDGKHRLYGTTQQGGAGSGSVFELRI